MKVKVSELDDKLGEPFWNKVWLGHYRNLREAVPKLSHIKSEIIAHSLLISGEYITVTFDRTVIKVELCD